ncbi:hypothetical protein WKW77_34085 [Variovorax ureilyticus]|uniref:Uncharacterized protein n=1 Tax=Variovorax ureilyticus TaxID=1836198 RepID=A0ABU8VR35_9BURK
MTHEAMTNEAKTREVTIHSTPAQGGGEPMFRSAPEPFQCLPLFAKVAIERLDADHALRTGVQLDALLDAYAKTYGLACDEHTRFSAQYICERRYGATFLPLAIAAHANEVRA